jgi:hypothetical protein
LIEHKFMAFILTISIKYTQLLHNFIESLEGLKSNTNYFTHTNDHTKAERSEPRGVWGAGPPGKKAQP